MMVVVVHVAITFLSAYCAYRDNMRVGYDQGMPSKEVGVSGSGGGWYIVRHECHSTLILLPSNSNG